MCSNVCIYIFVFFFKQKTAYEMRISDWSSDVCSSDLAKHDCGGGRSRRAGCPRPADRARTDVFRRRACGGGGRAAVPASARLGGEPGGAPRAPPPPPAVAARACEPLPARTEEDTSELQSLMRISYAVVCLKKK